MEAEEFQRRIARNEERLRKGIRDACLAGINAGLMSAILVLVFLILGRVFVWLPWYERYFASANMNVPEATRVVLAYRPVLGCFSLAILLASFVTTVKPFHYRFGGKLIVIFNVGCLLVEAVLLGVMDWAAWLPLAVPLAPFS